MLSLTLEKMYESLPVDRWITKAELSLKWGIKDERIVRDIVRTLRLEIGGSDGNVIVSLSDNSGYIKTSDKGLRKRYAKETTHRADETKRPLINQMKKLGEYQILGLTFYAQTIAKLKKSKGA